MRIVRSATLSACRTYRYTLERMWYDERPLVMFIGLNPSIADESIDDRTTVRCMRFAGAWGFGGLIMTNLFGYRSTDPRGLRKAPDPVGPENDAHLVRSASRAHTVIAAWGNDGAYMGRCEHVASLVPRLFCLGVTREGHPRHPLFLLNETKPIEWRSP